MTTTTLNHHHEFNTPPPTLHHRRVALIKRPPLVRSSSPTLSVRHNKKPKKSVRFCDNDSLENVRLFLKTQMPKACQSDPTCPKQYSYRLRRPNWPSSDNRLGAIRIEDIHLETGNKLNLVGACQVANLAFEKHISIIYSFDDWTTTQKVDAQYQEPIKNSANTWDRFNFKITAPSSSHTLYLAAKYTVNGREFWDNNDHKNYQVDIISDVQLDLQQDDISTSSSSDEEDDENTFEDCVHEDDENTFEDYVHEDEEDELVEQLKPLTLSNTKSSFGNRYDFDSAIDKPWTPPLSPTTPVDHSPLWAPSTTSTSKEYFNNEKQNTTSTEYNKFNDIIHKYCYYSDHHKPTFFTQYHSVPPRCSSPKVIHS